LSLYTGNTFRGWLWTITQNKIRDHFRQTGREPYAVGGTSFQDVLAHVPAGGSSSGYDSSDAPPADPLSLYRRAIDLIRSEFEDRTWQAFWRVTVDGRSPADVGQELGMSPAAVRKAKSRVLQRLRRELGEPT
jgi:RNA polymerase sigma-70 factor (ECF subfamily)